MCFSRPSGHGQVRNQENILISAAPVIQGYSQYPQNQQFKIQGQKCRRINKKWPYILKAYPGTLSVSPESALQNIGTKMPENQRKMSLYTEGAYPGTLSVSPESALQNIGTFHRNPSAGMCAPTG